MPTGNSLLSPFGALDIKDLLVMAEMNVAWPEFVYELHLELSKHEFERKQTVLIQLQEKFQAISSRVQSAYEHEMHIQLNGKKLPKRLSHVDFSSLWASGQYKPLIQNLLTYMVEPLLGESQIGKVDMERMPSKLTMVAFATEVINKIGPVEKVLIGDQVWMFNFLKQVVDSAQPKLSHSNPQVHSVNVVVPTVTPNQGPKHRVAIDWNATASMIRHSRLNPKVDEIKKLNNERQWSEHSPLNMLGYSVDARNGLNETERREFLVDFCDSMILPLGLPQGYAQPWGEPGTKKRILKTAKHLSFLRRNFEKQDPVKYARAITSWQRDFDFLKNHYAKSSINQMDWFDAYKG